MRGIIIFILVLVLGVAGVYIYMSGKKYPISLTETQLKAKLDEHLPVKNTYLFIIDVTLDNSRVALLEGSDRINAGVDVTVAIRAGSTPTQFKGTVDAAAGVRYEPTKGQFFLTNPTVEKVTIPGVPDSYTSKVNTVISSALSEYFAKQPVYTLDATDYTQRATQLVLKDVIIKDRRLILELGI